MTVGLCLQCGAVKLAALAPCWQCGAGPTGREQIDIVFSDRVLTRETLEQFGAVVRAIAERTPDPNARFWTFIHYVSTHHPRLLKVELQPTMLARATKILSGVDVPAVELSMSPRPQQLAGATAGRFLVLLALLIVGLLALLAWRFVGA